MLNYIISATNIYIYTFFELTRYYFENSNEKNNWVVDENINYNEQVNNVIRIDAYW